MIGVGHFQMMQILGSELQNEKLHVGGENDEVSWV